MVKDNENNIGQKGNITGYLLVIVALLILSIITLSSYEMSKNLYEGNIIKTEKYIFNDEFSKILYNIPYEKDYVLHDYDCSNM